MINPIRHVSGPGRHPGNVVIKYRVIVVAGLAIIAAAGTTAGAARPVPTAASAPALPGPVTAYVIGVSNKVIPIRTATNTPRKAIRVGNDPLAIAVTPDGRTVYVASFINIFKHVRGTVTPIDTATNTAGKPIRVGREPLWAAITPNGRTLYVASEINGNKAVQGTVTPIDMATNKPGRAIKVGIHPQAIAVTPDGKTVFVVNLGSGTVTPIRTATNTAEERGGGRGGRSSMTATRCRGVRGRSAA
jgi:DNA-binding beta-propeller fold protein YncE